MNYVILNGVRSNTITGLLIQKLPPISKPLMRTQVDLIDGRDGDIVTRLGYSAYDKPIEIGLHGDYDVDEAIRYFDSKGTVIFSNEPDKFYFYEIIDQIDFEKLIRFKTATVTFHCQPFKYSAVDRIFMLNNQHLKISDYTETKNGITLTVNDGDISISGTGSEATEFILPVSCVLDAGDYTLKAKATGTNPDACMVRVMTGADTFGDDAITLSESAQTLTESESTNKRYDLLWIYCEAGEAMEFTFYVEITRDNVNRLELVNRGNMISKPILTVYGDGSVTISLNGKQILIVNIGDRRWITIDSAQMNAFKGDIFMNRYVVGDYDDLALPVGRNVITWTGNVSKITLENYSRWK